MKYTECNTVLRPAVRYEYSVICSRYGAIARHLALRCELCPPEPLNRLPCAAYGTSTALIAKAVQLGRGLSLQGYATAATAKDTPPGVPQKTCRSRRVEGGSSSYSITVRVQHQWSFERLLPLLLFFLSRASMPSCVNLSHAYDSALLSASPSLSLLSFPQG